jgi:hypothetical protein
MAKPRLQFSGKTVDGMLVVKNVFYFKDTLGIPLVAVAEALK